MDFFEHQERARRRTGVLFVSLFATVVCLVTALYFVSLQPYLAHLQKSGRLDGAPIDVGLMWQPILLAYVGAVVLLTIALAGLYKIVRLRRGGAAIAELLGAARIDARTETVGEQRLINVVEEMAIASGIPVPPVYLLEMSSINAFAAGWNPSNAVLVVTRGSLTHLSRDELQAVIAHELSHIINGDTGLNVQLLGLLHGITFIGLTGLTLVRATRHLSFGGEAGKDVGCALAVPLLFVGLPLAAIGYAGVLAARVTKSAIAREREYLADAAAVQFTRNPGALVSALKKIGGHATGSRIFHSRAEQLSHFFFSEGVQPLVLKPSFFRGWFRAHPSLHERIARVDDSFDGEFPRTAPVTAGTITSRVGNASPESVARGRAILQAMPDALRKAVRRRDESILLLYAMLVPRASDAQFRSLEFALSPEELRAVRGYHEAIAPLGREARLVLVDLAAPALRELDEAMRATVLRRLATFAESDGRFDPFEDVVYAVIQRRLDERSGSRTTDVRSTELAVVVSTMARAGHASEPDAAKAYDVALLHLPPGIPMPERPLKPEELGRDNLVQALRYCAGHQPRFKKQILDACVRAALADRSVTDDEAGLIRAVACALDCPIPPLALRS